MLELHRSREGRSICKCAVGSDWEIFLLNSGGSTTSTFVRLNLHSARPRYTYVRNSVRVPVRKSMLLRDREKSTNAQTVGPPHPYSYRQ